MLVWQAFKGLSPYNETLALMEQMVGEVIVGARPETVLLVEHEDIYTAGTSAKDDEILNAGNIPVCYTGRGGKFTYHGPGQRVIYPILDLGAQYRQKDLKLYIQDLENWIIVTLQHFGIKAYIVPGRVGIWARGPMGEAKIGAIGVRVKKWVTYHGIAVNISTDLTKFSGIIQCGLKDSPATSMHEIGAKVSMQEFDEALKKYTKFNSSSLLL